MISCGKLAQLGVVLPDPLAPHRGEVYVSGQLLREGKISRSSVRKTFRLGSRTVVFAQKRWAMPPFLPPTRTVCAS
jgi:hypothetical protein